MIKRGWHALQYQYSPFFLFYWKIFVRRLLSVLVRGCSDVCARRSQSFCVVTRKFTPCCSSIFANRKKAEEEETLRKEAEAEAAAQIAELDRQLKVIL